MEWRVTDLTSVGSPVLNVAFTRAAHHRRVGLKCEKLRFLPICVYALPTGWGEFDEGVEVGVIATLMALGEGKIRRRISQASVIQWRPLAEHFRYRITTQPLGDSVEVTLEPTYRRPLLRIVG